MSITESAARGTGTAGAAGAPGAAGAVGAVGAAGTVAGPGGRAVWRRSRLPALVAALVVGATLLVGAAQARVVRGQLDPRATDPQGSRAIAVLLGARGVPVRRVTDVAGATHGADGRTVLVVPFPERLTRGQLERLASTAATLVLVAPGDTELDAAGAGIRTAGSTRVAGRAPSCHDRAASTAGDADLGGRVYHPGGGVGCYPAADGSALVLGRRAGGGRLVVLGTGAPLTNERLDRRGNAALSLLLLGGDGSADRVLWLMPVPGSAASGRTSITDIVPPWVVPAAVQLLLGCLVVAFWRGRRLGPPVVEPLPVVVRAAETVEGRARLYRRAGARDRAADALRAGALARLLPPLGLGTDPVPAAVVSAVATRTGTPEPAVGALLYGPPPPDDTALVRLADELDAIVVATSRMETR